MRMKIYLILADFLIFHNAFKFINAKPMVGENVRYVREGEFPFVVSVKPTNIGNTEPEKDHGSTGILVSRQDVLTAGHVFDYLEGSVFEIIVGSMDIRNGRKYFPWWWMSYDKWTRIYAVPNQSEMNDIAIIRLTKNVPDSIRPVILSSLHVTDLFGLSVMIAGWGKTINGEISRYMKTTVLKIISSRECEYKMLMLRGLQGHVPENIICSVANPPAIMADGDSGGPVLFNGELVGVHKGTCLFPHDCFHPNKINLHMSTDYYRNFIAHVVSIS